MAKDAYYFSHDGNARNDEKLLAVRMKYKWEGYGLFWAIVEKLRESTNYALSKDYNLIAFDLRTEASIIKSLIEDFGLFVFTEDGKYFYSERLRNSMEFKEAKSEKARESINKRWEKYKSNTDEIRTYNDGNTIKGKESIGKEKKGKESKGKENIGNVDSPEIFENEIVLTPAQNVLLHLNEMAGRNYDLKAKGSLKHINARLSEGHSVELLKEIIDLKCFEWLKNEKMTEYLQPDTLFNLEKFTKYLEQLSRAKHNPEQFKKTVHARNNTESGGISEMQRYKQQLIDELSGK